MSLEVKSVLPETQISLNGVAQEKNEKNKNLNETQAKTHSAFFLSLKQDFESKTIDLNPIQSRFLLQSAIKEQDLDALNFLIEKGINIERLSAQQTPLLYAIQEKKIDVVKLLLEKGANIEANTYATTPLLYAIQEKNLDMVKLLLEKGANIETGAFGSTPLIAAIMQRDLAIIKLLLEKGAKIEPENVIPFIGGIMGSGSDSAIVNFLLEKGANVLAQGRWGNMIIMGAIRCGWEESIKILLQDPSYHEEKDQLGRTPWILAMLLQRNAIADLLAHNGADLNYGNEYLNRIILAHFFGIGGQNKINDQSIELEGCDPDFMLKQLLENLQDFFSQTQLCQLSESQKDIILQTFNRALSSRDSINSIMQEVSLGKPVLLSLNLFGHAAYIILANKKMMLCNRGGYTSSPGIQVFNAENITSANLYDLVNCFQDIKELVHKNFGDCLYAIEQKRQKIGNCSWASAKSAFLALLLISLNMDKEKAKNIYKQFTQYVRKTALEKYLRTSSLVDTDLIKKCSAKLNKTS